MSSYIIPEDCSLKLFHLSQTPGSLGRCGAGCVGLTDAIQN